MFDFVQLLISLETELYDIDIMQLRARRELSGRRRKAEMKLTPSSCATADRQTSTSVSPPRETAAT